MKTQKQTDLNQDKWMRYEKDIIKYYYPEILEWIRNGDKHPTMAFTSGLGRDIAMLIYNERQKQREDELKFLKNFKCRDTITRRNIYNRVKELEGEK